MTTREEEETAFQHGLSPSDFTLLLNCLPIMAKRGAFNITEYGDILPVYQKMVKIAKKYPDLFAFDEEKGDGSSEDSDFEIGEDELSTTTGEDEEEDDDEEVSVGEEGSCADSSSVVSEEEKDDDETQKEDQKKSKKKDKKKKKKSRKAEVSAASS